MPRFETRRSPVAFARMVESIGATRKSRGWSAERAAVSRYVGLEHLDSDRLKIQRWGSIEPVGENSDLRVFEPGDVIFARRRLYQRKVGVATFRGAASGHALVFRARSEVVAPQLLPFLLQAALDRLIALSVGSLSPTVNWTDLAEQSFFLPPRENQAALVKLFRAVEETIEVHREVVASLATLLDSETDEIFLTDHRSPALSIDLGSLVEIDPESASRAEYQSDAAIRYIDISCVTHPKCIGGATEYKFSDAPSRARKRVRSGDIIVSTVRPSLRSFARIEPEFDRCIASTGFAVLRPRHSGEGSYLLHSLFSSRFLQHSVSKSEGTSYPAIRNRDVARFKLPAHSHQQREAIGQRLDSIEKAIREAESRVEQFEALKRALYREHLA